MFLSISGRHVGAHPDGLNLLNDFYFYFDLFWMRCHWKPAIINEMILFFLSGFQSSMISHIPRHQDVLMGWTIEAPLLCERYWVPCFRGAVDGWHSHIFHRKCDNLGPTLTIARKDSYLFGGFADKSWKSKSSIIYFIFIMNFISPKLTD